jgi:hypothetical protein
VHESPLLQRIDGPPVYDSIRIDGNLLKSLYNSKGFTSLSFNIKNVSGKFDLTPSMVLPGLVKVFSSGPAISGSKILVPYLLQHYNVSQFLQLRAMVSIVDLNPGSYFTLIPGTYTNNSYISYSVNPYKSTGVAISKAGNAPRLYQLDPCPPARSY